MSEIGAVTQLVDALLLTYGDQVDVSEGVRDVHGAGEAFHRPAPPDAVFFARSTEQVADVVARCAAARVSIIAYGAGTSLEGGISAPTGGICIDMTRMNDVLAVNAEDLDCAVQAGVTREALNAHLRDTGLFFPIDPGANATIGGMAATRASGTTAVRYGTMRTNVLWLTVVLSDGTVLRTARRARKTSAGYDLTGLFVGSEGTLGIITEVGLRLHGRPESTAAAICSFGELRSATDCVIMLLQMGVPVARVELMDAMQVQASNAYSGTSLQELSTLLFEFHGSDAAVAEQAELVGGIADMHGGSSFEWARSEEDRSRLWKARHNAYHAAQALRPGSRLLVTDVCVPISRLSDCLEETHADLAEAGVRAPIVGHVGDGNFHVFLPVMPDDPGDVRIARELNDRLVERALRMDGTCTGEHGIGLGKRSKLLDELGAPAVALMSAIKGAVDQSGMLNPGKIFVASRHGEHA